MKLICLSDGHLTLDKSPARVDDFKTLAARKFSFVVNFAKLNGIKYILSAGDLFNNRRSWKMAEVFATIFKDMVDNGISLISVVGQHDSYYHNINEKSVLFGVMENSGFIQRANSKPINIGPYVVMIYGASWGEEIPVPVDDRHNRCLNILIVHRQILMEKIWRGHEGYDYAPGFLKRNRLYDLIICGDIHRRFYFQDGKRIILNAGPMMRLRADENEIKHMPGFYVYDTNNKLAEWFPIPAEKGEEVFSERAVESEKTKELVMGEFADLLLSDDCALDFESIFDQYIKKNKVRKGVLSILDDTKKMVDVEL